MQDSNPYGTPTASIDHSVSGESRRVNRNTAISLTLATLVLCLISGGAGLVAGVPAGFVVFGDAGDSTMIFVTPCILLGGACGAALGAGLGILVGGLFGAAFWQR